MASEDFDGCHENLIIEGVRRKRALVGAVEQDTYVAIAMTPRQAPRGLTENVGRRQSVGLGPEREREREREREGELKRVKAKERERETHSHNALGQLKTLQDVLTSQQELYSHLCPRVPTAEQRYRLWRLPGHAPRAVGHAPLPRRGQRSFEIARGLSTSVHELCDLQERTEPLSDSPSLFPRSLSPSSVARWYLCDSGGQECSCS